MDRKSKQKLKKYILVYLIFALLFTVGMHLIMNYEEDTKALQIAMLLEKHPEMEGEVVAAWEKSGTPDLMKNADKGQIKRVKKLLEETYGYHVGIGSSETVLNIVWAAGLFAGSIFCIVLFFISRRKDVDADEKQVQRLQECLLEFRKGKFTLPPAETEQPEAWMQVWESMRELGAYFGDLKERLEQEEDSTKRLITDISHQLKTPLSSLKMSHEMIAEGLVTEEEKENFLEQETQEIKKLEQLLDELVNLSRLEAHMIQIHPQKTSLKKTLAEAVSQIYMKARGKDISVSVEMENDIVLEHDSKWTVEALANILENAVKYSQEHTAVTVRIQQLVSYVLIEVEDEGIGIPTEELHKIYQRFYRGSKAKEQVKDGAGVGLYLARKIIEEQGGTLTAKGKIGRGTIFKITLPLE